MSRDQYTLYGSYASYATAKTRSYLRKKNIPFVERVPGVTRFRQYVRQQSLNHRIPQIEAPDGTVIQDTPAIFDYLEARFPEPPGYPPGPRQQTVARLLEVLWDAELGRPAWHYRWNYMDENYGFVGREFGRSFRPRGSDHELDHYGNIIRERMEGKRGALGDDASSRPVFEALYTDMLAGLEAHFTVQPYLFGGLPSIADHVLMGPLFGHLARDPVPATIMKQRAPRVFRWTEHMNTPEIVSPELADAPAEYLADDEIPVTLLALLRQCLTDVGETITTTASHYNEWVADQGDLPSASVIEDGVDEPLLGSFEATIRGVPISQTVNVHMLWVLQRALDWFATLNPADQDTCHALLNELGGPDLLDIGLERRLTRVDNCMALD